MPHRRPGLLFDIIDFGVPFLTGTSSIISTDRVRSARGSVLVFLNKIMPANSYLIFDGFDDSHRIPAVPSTPIFGDIERKIKLVLSYSVKCNFTIAQANASSQSRILAAVFKRREDWIDFKQNFGGQFPITTSFDLPHGMQFGFTASTTSSFTLNEHVGAKRLVTRYEHGVINNDGHGCWRLSEGMAQNASIGATQFPCAGYLTSSVDTSSSGQFDDDYLKINCQGKQFIFNNIHSEGTGGIVNKFEFMFS